MKKLFTIILFSALAIGLAGCSNNDSGSNSNISNNNSNYTLTSPSEKTEQSSENSTNISTGEQKPTASSNTGNTVLTAAADAHNSQTLYLWEEDNVPATTEYTVNNGNYFDDPDFRPYVVTFPVPEGTEIKGAVLICAGGAFQFRSDHPEGTPVAEELSKLGYQSFVV